MKWIHLYRGVTFRKILNLMNNIEDYLAALFGFSKGSRKLGLLTFLCIYCLRGVSVSHFKRLFLERNFRIKLLCNSNVKEGNQFPLLPNYVIYVIITSPYLIQNENEIERWINSIGCECYILYFPKLLSSFDHVFRILMERL